MIDLKEKLIVIKLKHMYADDPVDRLRGVNVVHALQNRGWNIQIFNNQKNIDLIIYLDDYNLYDRLVYEYTKARKVIIDIQDNHFIKSNASSQYQKKKGQYSFKNRVFAEIKKGFKQFIYKVLIKKLWYLAYLESVKKVDYIICSSYALMNSYVQLNSNVICIPDTLEQRCFQVNKVVKQENLSICWVGTENNIAYLAIVEQAIQELQEKYNIEFCIISSKNIFLDKRLHEIMQRLPFTYKFVEWKKDTIYKELAKHHIGIAPLPQDSEKSTNKILTYMASGLAVACSGGKDYQKMNFDYPQSLIYIQRNSAEKWKDSLEQLIIDDLKRERLVENGLKVAQNYQLDKIVVQYEELFEKIFEKESV
jgi:hypothetical protein